MDFLKLIRSFEELLFEALSWLVYYPRTMWKIMRHPLRMMTYADHERLDAQQEQYTDALSPPLLLLLTVAVTHIAAARKAPPPRATNNLAAEMVFASDESLILASAFLYGLLPLLAAWRYVRVMELPPERKYLHPPFLGQCYIASPYALGMAMAFLVGGSAFERAHLAGALIAASVTLWYVSVQTLQFQRSTASSLPKAFMLAMRAFCEALAIFIAIALAISVA